MELWFFSPGRWLILEMAIFYMMQTVTPDMYVRNMPRNSHVHGLLYSALRMHQRIKFPHARIILHEPADASYLAWAPYFFF